MTLPAQQKRQRQPTDAGPDDADPLRGQITPSAFNRAISAPDSPSHSP